MARAQDLRANVAHLVELAAGAMEEGSRDAGPGSASIPSLLDSVTRLVGPLAEPRARVAAVAGALPPVDRPAATVERELLLVTIRCLVSLPPDATDQELRVVATRATARQIRIEVRMGPSSAVVLPLCETLTLPVSETPVA